MIGTCIALAIWTSGLLYLTNRNEKRRLLEAQSDVAVEKNYEAGVRGDIKV